MIIKEIEEILRILIETNEKKLKKYNNIIKGYIFSRYNKNRLTQIKKNIFLYVKNYLLI